MCGAQHGKQIGLDSPPPFPHRVIGPPSSHVYLRTSAPRRSTATRRRLASPAHLRPYARLLPIYAYITTIRVSLYFAILTFAIDIDFRPFMVLIMIIVLGGDSIPVVSCRRRCPIAGTRPTSSYTFCSKCSTHPVKASPQSRVSSTIVNIV